jgi:hypothetical protein
VVIELDIWRTASVLIRNHGEDAEMMAARQADALLAAGDVEGARVFKAITNAVVELRRAKRQDGEQVN